MQCVWATESSPVGLQVNLTSHDEEFGFYSKNSVEQMENLKKCDYFRFEKNTLAGLWRLDNTRAWIDTDHIEDC